MAGALLLTACSFAPEPQSAGPAAEVPEAFASQAVHGPYQPQAWWTRFDDPLLNDLVDSALVANLDLAQAAGRVEEVRALAGISTADLFPRLTGTAGASRQNNPGNAGFGAIIGAILGGGAAGDSTEAGGEDPESPRRSTINSFDAGLGLAYELDIWGRVRNDRRASLSDLTASAFDFQVVQLGVVGETITAYFDLADLLERVRRTEEVVGVLAEREELSVARYDRGLITSFELYTVRQERQAAEASIPLLRSQIGEARRRLALVTGRHLDGLDSIFQDRATPPWGLVPLDPIPPGIPADLLIQRPDVRASAQRMEAARLRVGARRAELLPAIDLSATLGLQSSSASGLFDLSQWFSNLASSLTVPLFQGGRLRSNLDAAQARYAQQVASHGQTVLTAVGEVEAALLRHEQEVERFETLSAQLAEARSSVTLQAERYQAGIGAYTDYLDALRVRLATESTLSSAARDVALARLRVHRALGGSWAPVPHRISRMSSTDEDHR